MKMFIYVWMEGLGMGAWYRCHLCVLCVACPRPHSLLAHAAGGSMGVLQKPTCLPKETLVLLFSFSLPTTTLHTPPSPHATLPFFS